VSNKPVIRIKFYTSCNIWQSTFVSSQNQPTMSKKTLISIAILSNLLVAGFFILQSATPTKKAEKSEPVKPKEQAICAQLNTATCTPTIKSNTPGEMIVESLSRQFLSIPGLYR
jgi:hypothetical protein